MTAIYIGVMTGTSMDGVDIVAASFDPLAASRHPHSFFRPRFTR